MAASEGEGQWGELGVDRENKEVSAGLPLVSGLC